MYRAPVSVVDHQVKILVKTKMTVCDGSRSYTLNFVSTPVVTVFHLGVDPSDVKCLMLPS